MSHLPLFVDLDGTLITDDSLLEGVLGCLRAGPKAWKDVLVIRNGIPAFKRAMSRYIGTDLLVVREAVVRLIDRAKQEGNKVILATGANEYIARRVAERLGYFDAVIASEDEVNRVSTSKLEAIQAWTGGAPFAYVGNSRQDIVIWQAAARASVVGGWWQRWMYWPRIPVERRGEYICVSFPWRELFRALRPQQWVKNLLVLAPLVAGHVWVAATWARTFVGMVVFCLLCSTVYIANDLLDVPHDRQHPQKRLRPIALGTVPTMLAIRAACVLLAVVIIGSYALASQAFGLVLLCYAVLAWSYSLLWKRVFALDVFVLAGLYSLRLYAGSFLAQVPLSSWLIGVSFFLFMSLACLKRFSSLQRTRGGAVPVEAGRAYREADQAGLGVVGLGSAMAAVIMLCLYMQSDAARRLYERPVYLFAVVPIVFFVFVRAWMLAYRGELQDDPVAAFARDPVVYGAVSLTVLLAALAS